MYVTPTHDNSSLTETQCANVANVVNSRKTFLSIQKSEEISSN